MDRGSLLYLPDAETGKLVYGPVIQLADQPPFMEWKEILCWSGKSEEIHWLNTPGPVYTGCTDNVGTGQTEAIRNIGGDEDYREVVFKQPVNLSELTEVLNAAISDPFGDYAFDGNSYWNTDLIKRWWSKSTERINYIILLYKYELGLPDDLQGRLYGPSHPVPENYQMWLEFYQYGMKDYLEWYAGKIQNEKLNLTGLEYDWSKKDELDLLCKTKMAKRSSNIPDTDA